MTANIQHFDDTVSHIIPPDIKVYIIGDPYTFEGKRAMSVTRRSFEHVGFTNCINQDFCWIHKWEQGGYDYTIPLSNKLGKKDIARWYSYVNVLRKIRRLEDKAVIITQQGAKLHSGLQEDPAVFANLEYMEEPLVLDPKVVKLWPLAKGSKSRNVLWDFGTYLTPQMAWSLVNQICKAKEWKNDPIGIDIDLNKFLDHSFRKWLAHDSHADLLHNARFAAETAMSTLACPINVDGG